MRVVHMNRSGSLQTVYIRARFKRYTHIDAAALRIGVQCGGLPLGQLALFWLRQPDIEVAGLGIQAALQG